MNDQISDGAAMLIARMKTHPEEFAPGGRLRYLVDRASRVANRQDTSLAIVDATALCAAMQPLYKQELTEIVIRGLLGAPAEALPGNQLVVGQGFTGQAAAAAAQSQFHRSRAGAANMQNGYYGASPQSAVTNTAASMSPLGTLLRSKLGDIF